MKRTTDFRPSITGLEDRIALSGATAWVFPAATSFTPIQILTVQREQTAITTFAQGYQSAVQSILLAPGQGGVVTPSANRAAFDAKVATLLTTLQKSLDTDVKLMPNSTTLTADVNNIISGSASTSLKNELAAIPTPTSTSNVAVAAFEAQAVAAVGLADANLTSDVLGYGTITPIS